MKISFLFLCVIAMCYSTVFATGWKYDPVELWQYFDSDGELVTDSIKEKDGLKFYLDDNGHVRANYLLEDYHGNTYYFNYFGAMASNTWVRVDVKDIENYGDYIPDTFYFYYYFDQSGKAVKGTREKPRVYYVDSLPYIFNEYGQMLTGYITENGEIINPDTEEYVFEEALYHADELTGVLTEGWVECPNPYEDVSYLEDVNTLWLYFNPKTHKKSGFKKPEQKVINHNTYFFSDKGYTYTRFGAFEAGVKDKLEYYGETDEKGELKKNKWVYSLPPEKSDKWDEEDREEKHWFYFDNQADLVTNKLKKINKKYYTFDEKGIMRTGLVAFLNGKILFVADMDETSGEDIIKKGKFTYKKDGVKYYFYDTAYRNRITSLTTYYTGSDDPTAESYLPPYYWLEWRTNDEYANSHRDFTFTGRRKYDSEGNLLFDDIGYLYNSGIHYYYLLDNGELVDGTAKVHFYDNEYTYGGNQLGHYNGKKKDFYYYDGIRLEADKDIGYGIYCIEQSLPQTKQINPYTYLFAPLSYKSHKSIYMGVEIDFCPEKYLNLIPDGGIPYYYIPNDNESIYKVLNASGKLVKAKKNAYKDKYSHYWYVKGKDFLYGIFDTPVKEAGVTVTLNTLIDREACPDELLNGTAEEKVDYFRTLEDYDDGGLEWAKYSADLLFYEDFKDYYTFIKSGKISNVRVTESKDDPDKLQVSFKYTGDTFKSVRNDKSCYVPFGMKDDGDQTATFFTYNNDFNVLPDSNEYFTNCCWDDPDAIDLMVSGIEGIDDDRHIDFWD